MRPLFSLVLLLSSSLSAGIVERTPLTTPQSQLVAAGYGRVVASDGGAFLVHGQRISRDGVKLDEEPIAGADGYAVAWHDGWLIIQSHLDRLSIRHLGESGAPELGLEIPRLGEFVAAASANGRLAILERVYGFEPTSIWLTTTDGARILQRRKLGQLHDATIARFGDGFLVVTQVRATERTTILHAWRIDADGTPREVRTIGEIPYSFPALKLATEDGRAILATHSASELRAWVMDASLDSTAAVEIHAPPFGDVTIGFPLTVSDGYLLSYGLRVSGIEQNRAIVLRNDGTVVSDAPADPIVAGDRFDGRYLVLRPWGDAGLAEDDPRRIVVAIPLQRRVYEQIHHLDVVNSGDVSLVGFGDIPSKFVRTDAEGNTIDAEPILHPGRIAVAIPQGFAFVWRAGDDFWMRRLSRRGGWIDSDPIRLAAAANVLSFDAQSNGRDLLLAWNTIDEILWTRFSFDGASVVSEPSRVSRSSRSSTTVLGVTARGDDRLILAQTAEICRITCVTPPLPLDALVIDGNGSALGGVKTVTTLGSNAQAVGLPDGTWVVPIGAKVIQLARDGSFLGESTLPLMENLVDFVPTAHGWKAIAASPLRIAEIRGVDVVERLIGLSDLSAPRFGVGERLVFLNPTPLENALVPWSGRLATTDGDLAITLRAMPREPRGTHLQVLVQNKGATPATNAYVGGWSVFEKIPTIAPGETRYVTLAFNHHEDLLFALSDDVADVNPSDNAARVSEAGSAPRRSRSSRP